MQLSELQTFLAIVETGSLVKASRRLHVTQSTVTARLRSLEEEIGQTLINRQKSGATLTAAGIKLQRYASTMTQLWAQARKETALPDGMSSVCHFGCHSDLWPGFGKPVFEWLQSEVPDAAMSLLAGSLSELSAWMNDGVIDMTLSYGGNTASEQRVVWEGTESLVLVSTQANSPIRFDPDYVYVDAGDTFARDHNTEYADAGVARVQFNRAEWALQHLLDKRGSAYLPLHTVQPHLEAGRLYRLNEAPVFQRPITLSVSDEARHAWQWLDACVQYIESINATALTHP